MANTSHPVSIRVPEDLLVELDAVSVAENRSRSYLILEAVQDKYGSGRSGIRNVSSKKIAEVSAGVVAQDGIGVDPGLPRGGKAQDELESRE